MNKKNLIANECRENSFIGFNEYRMQSGALTKEFLNSWKLAKQKKNYLASDTSLFFLPVASQSPIIETVLFFTVIWD